MRLSTFSLFMLFFSITGLHAQEIAIHTPPRSISTSGESIVYVVPDEVIVNFGVQTFDRDLDKAKASNDDQSARLLKAIKSLGIEDKHIQTDTLNIDIQYNDRHQGIEGYGARRIYSVTLKDTKLLEKLIDRGLKNGANQLHGFEFKTSELRKHRDQARKMAIKAAKEKAVALAGELEMKVGKPRTINEGSVGYYYGRSWGGNSFGNASQNSVQAAPEGGEGGETMPLGQMAVRASVSVTFDLE